MANRREFTKGTKREALKRSGLLCEAIGAMYGLPDGKRCNAPLSAGVQYDHIVLDANSKDNSLENAAAVCIPCHRWKTANHDTPMAAKTVRMQDKARNIRTAPVAKIKSAPFPTSPKAERRQTKQPLAPRPLYYGPRSVVLCDDCGETITVDTAPFFANPGSQREYETHKTMGVWNEQMGDKP